MINMELTQYAIKPIYTSLFVQENRCPVLFALTINYDLYVICVIVIPVRHIGQNEISLLHS